MLEALRNPALHPSQLLHCFVPAPAFSFECNPLHLQLHHQPSPATATRVLGMRIAYEHYFDYDLVGLGIVNIPFSSP